MLNDSKAQSYVVAQPVFKTAAAKAGRDEHEGLVVTVGQ